jgi:hypothetical protein
MRAPPTHLSVTLARKPGSYHTTSTHPAQTPPHRSPSLHFDPVTVRRSLATYQPIAAPRYCSAKWTIRSIERPDGRPGARRGGECEGTGGDREDPSPVLRRVSQYFLPDTKPPHRSAQLSPHHRIMLQSMHTSMWRSHSVRILKQCPPRSHMWLPPHALLRLAHAPPLLGHRAVTPSSLTPGFSSLIEMLPPQSTSARSDLIAKAPQGSH